MSQDTSKRGRSPKETDRFFGAKGSTTTGEVVRHGNRHSVAVFCPNGSDATSYWRAIGPLSHLKRHHMPDTEFQVMPRAVDWDDLAWCDVAFVQRPMSDSGMRLCDLLEEMGKKLWLDFDDNLLNVPPGNPAFATFSKPEVRKNVEKLIKRANLITVSTQHLKQIYSQFNTAIHVIPNAWDHENYPDRSRMKRLIPVYSKMLVWRGSRTHDTDLMLYLPKIAKCLRDFPEWKITFVGSPLQYAVDLLAKEFGQRVRLLQPLPTHQFMHFMNHLQPTVGIVPLEDCPFNHSKSNIAWQEMTYGSAVVVAPNTREWQRPGIQNYESPENFGAVLSYTMSQTQEWLSEQNERSWQDMRDNYNLHRWNARRAAILTDLLESIYGNTDTEDRQQKSEQVPTFRDTDDEAGRSLCPA